MKLLLVMNSEIFLVASFLFILIFCVGLLYLTFYGLKFLYYAHTSFVTTTGRITEVLCLDSKGNVVNLKVRVKFNFEGKIYDNYLFMNIKLPIKSIQKIEVGKTINIDLLVDYQEPRPFWKHRIVFIKRGIFCLFLASLLICCIVWKLLLTEPGVS